MSRVQVRNDRYVFACGVDHAIGTFFDIWEAGQEDEAPAVSADSQFGLRVVRQEILQSNARLAEELDLLRDAWVQATGRGILHPNLGPEHVLRIAEALGFERAGLARRVYAAWD